jgi:uncharacterized protein
VLYAFTTTTVLALVLLGFGVGVFGTLVGAGGGFILTPMLLVVYPHDSPQTITAISIAVVFFNAGSGSIAYARQHRIDYRSGLVCRCDDAWRGGRGARSRSRPSTRL